MFEKHTMSRTATIGSSSKGSDATPLTQGTAPAIAGAQPATVMLPINALLPADSPRLAGEDSEHARALAQTGSVLPPILVHRPTMRVIDGMHRLRAAVIRGQDTIEAQFFDGSEDAAFVLAVEANIAHGLPLSLADREVAAARIIASHPQCSDRWIAKSTGLASKTVGAIRQRLSVALPPLTARTGRDGRVRPLNSAQGRQLASVLIAAKPDASLREIAKATGISLGTARDVRARLHRGDDPIPARLQGGKANQQCTSSRARQSTGRGGRQATVKDARSTLETLKRDPTLRFNEVGRDLLRWLDRHAIQPEDWANLVDRIPPHCTVVIADLARNFAQAWQSFAQEIEQRGQSTA